MKKQQNNSTSGLALRITISVTLICASLILLVSISGPVQAGSRSPNVSALVSESAQIRNGQLDAWSALKEK